MAHGMDKGVTDQLKELYNARYRPVEQATKFGVTHTQGELTDSWFDSPPMVLLIGPYSVGKTSFIRYLLGNKDFPGCRVGPEPTTDTFSAIMYGEDERLVPGNALTIAPGSPFGGLTHFGNGFLTRFNGSVVKADILKNITLIGTPGVLSGQKQTMGRGYSYEKIVKWFAERCDMIIVLFDANKLDISDEMSATIKSLKGNEDKVRVVLNKAASVPRQSLMRIYGALMWSLSKVVMTPEVLRVYIGSFWNEPNKCAETATLIELEMASLLQDLRSLPASGAVRKLNELVKRGRLLKVHACLLDHLRSEMPGMFGNKEKKKRELLADLGGAFRTVQRAHALPPGDFPDMAHFKSVVEDMDFSAFPSLSGSRLKKGKAITAIDEALAEAIPRLMGELKGAAALGIED